MSTGAFVALIGLFGVCSAKDWSYSGDKGPSHWEGKCKEHRQSPIDIKSAKLTPSKELGEFSFRGYEVAPSDVTYQLVNNGHTVQLSVTSGVMNVSGGSLPGVFQLAQFHMHWGKDDCVGSEHKVDGAQYPLEIHLVHYNTKYISIVEAMTNEDGLAVLGIFADIGDQAHPTIDKLTDVMSAVKYMGSTTAVGTFNMSSILPANQKNFIRYAGSLTTPPCLETVTWTVFSEPIRVSATQMNAFRAVSHDKRASGHDSPQLTNYRPTLPIYKRTVSKSFDGTPSKPVKKVGCSASITRVTGSLASILVGLAFLTTYSPQSGQ